MKKSTMSRMLQIGDRKVDEATLADLCRQYRVRGLSFFGSAARGEMRPDSDIDLLVEFLPDAEIDLVDYAGLMLELSHLLGRSVDLVSKSGLKPLIRASVIEEARLLKLRTILAVIGEAAARVSEELKTRHPQVPWPQILLSVTSLSTRTSESTGRWCGGLPGIVAPFCGSKRLRSSPENRPSPRMQVVGCYHP